MTEVSIKGVDMAKQVFSSGRSGRERRRRVSQETVEQAVFCVHAATSRMSRCNGSLRDSPSFDASARTDRARGAPGLGDIRAGESPVLPDLLGQLPEDEPIGNVIADDAARPSSNRRQ